MSEPSMLDLSSVKNIPSTDLKYFRSTVFVTKGYLQIFAKFRSECEWLKILIYYRR